LGIEYWTQCTMWRVTAILSSGIAITLLSECRAPTHCKMKSCRPLCSSSSVFTPLQVCAHTPGRCSPCCRPAAGGTRRAPQSKRELAIQPGRPQKQVPVGLLKNTTNWPPAGFDRFEPCLPSSLRATEGSAAISWCFMACENRDCFVVHAKGVADFSQ